MTKEDILVAQQEPATRGDVSEFIRLLDGSFPG